MKKLLLIGIGIVILLSCKKAEFSENRIQIEKRTSVDSTIVDSTKNTEAGKDTTQIESVTPILYGPIDSTSLIVDFLRKNAKETDWSHEGFRTWMVMSVHLDTTKLAGTQLRDGGIYGTQLGLPTTSRYISLFQNSVDAEGYSHMRDFSFGKKDDVRCLLVREQDIVTTLTITTTGGKEFRWYRCPIRITEQKDPILHWQGGIPQREIKVIVAGIQMQ